MTVTKPKLYEIDYSQWLEGTVALLRDHSFSQLDLPHLIEELETLGRSEKRVLRSHLRILLLYLLKWQYQPAKRSSSWQASLRNARREIEDILRDSPSLKSHLVDSVSWCYLRSRKDAARETGLQIGTFPQDCPYPLGQILNEDCWP